jgi:hypothetical protein
MRTAITIAILLVASALVSYAQKTPAGNRGLTYNGQQIYEIRFDDARFECWEVGGVLHVRLAPQKYWPKETP